jgi:hypothetical protein
MTFGGLYLYMHYFYIKDDFDLQDAPSMEASIMTIRLISVRIVTVIFGVLVDRPSMEAMHAICFTCLIHNWFYPH